MQYLTQTKYPTTAFLNKQTAPMAGYFMDSTIVKCFYFICMTKHEGQQQDQLVN
jgi:hypothetical protein